MRVLVTRPASSGARTAKKLEARGHRPLLLPLTAAVHDIETTRTALETSPGAIAVTSAEAIRALQTLGTELARHLTRPLFAVGKATAGKAAAIGFTMVQHSQGDGAELADLIAAQRVFLDDRPLTYLAGFPRASGFEARLARHGVPFEIAECYRMEAIQPSTEELLEFLGNSPVDAILFYSGHAAERFFSLPEVAGNIARLKNTRLLCLSATIATIVPYVLHSQVEIAAAPEEDSLLGLL